MVSESVFRTYKNLIFLNADNDLQKIDLGLITSSAGNLLTIYLTYLRQNDIVTDAVSANVLVRKWNPAFKEWNTKSVRDVFFSSPQFPRLLNPESIKMTIANAVSSGTLAYVAKGNEGKYDPLTFNEGISISDIEISEDTFIITRESAKHTKLVLNPFRLRPKPMPILSRKLKLRKLLNQMKLQSLPIMKHNRKSHHQQQIKSIGKAKFLSATGLRFYKVITKFSANSNVKIKVDLECNSQKWVFTNSDRGHQIYIKRIRTFRRYNF